MGRGLGQILMKMMLASAVSEDGRQPYEVDAPERVEWYSIIRRG
jgi:hypothetical protein